MIVARDVFGTLPDGRQVKSYTLSNTTGMSVSICAWGGRIISLRIPDRTGEPGEISMGFPTLEPYLARDNYCGATIGRVANRIANGQFVLAGKRYSLWTQDHASLHGGEFGFNARLWKIGMDQDRVRLDYISFDGEEGYPGNLDVTVWYSLNECDLTIEYKATTDQTTLVNLTNHTFFNLNSFKRDVLAHELRITADKYTPVDENLIPTGEILPVALTPYDFTRTKTIGLEIDVTPNGYDHNYVFSTPPVKGELRWRGEIYDPDSGRFMAFATDQPCIQFYSGNFLDGSQTGLHGSVYKRRYAFCLETQKHPDAINHPNFASTILEPDEIYTHQTVYRFGAR